jgi:eukaryotic-like serine/threonine-protein kinase
MLQKLTCPRGHRYLIPAPLPGVDQASLSGCPICRENAMFNSMGPADLKQRRRSEVNELGLVPEVDPAQVFGRKPQPAAKGAPVIKAPPPPSEARPRRTDTGNDPTPTPEDSDPGQVFGKKPQPVAKAPPAVKPPSTPPEAKPSQTDNDAGLSPSHEEPKPPLANPPEPAARTTPIVKPASPAEARPPRTDTDNDPGLAVERGEPVKPPVAKQQTPADSPIDVTLNKLPAPPSDSRTQHDPQLAKEPVPQAKKKDLPPVKQPSSSSGTEVILPAGPAGPKGNLDDTLAPADPASKPAGKPSSKPVKTGGSHCTEKIVPEEAPGNLDDTLDPASRPSPKSSPDRSSPSATSTSSSSHASSVWRTRQAGASNEEPGQSAPSDDYEILGQLGRGGMGVVYKARHVALNRIVALKMIISGHHAGVEDKIRFRIEAEAAARLQHPNIVQVYDVGERDGHAYFSLEYLEGGSLQELLKKEGRQSNRKAAETIKSLAEAVHFAHQRGIIHRDLKPANILFASDGVPKLVDFGLAKSLGEQDQAQTRTDTVLGTPSYMSPEQARGNTKDVGAAADIYALGVILYELLTGQVPFRGETVMQTLQMVQNEEPKPPIQLQPKVARDLQTIALKCLEKKPEKRYASAEALAQDLGRYLNNEPILARPISTGERAWKWAKRHPMGVALMGVCSAAIIGVVWVILWSNADLQRRMEEYRRAALRAEGEKLLGEADDAFRREDYPQALSRVQAFKEQMDREPDLYEDLTPHADDLLAKTKPRVDNLQAFKAARQTYDDFKKQHDEVFFYQTLFTGAHSRDHLKKIQDLAEDALGKFGVKASDDSIPRIDENYFSKEEKTDITAGCYELLLALAETAARRQAPKEALQILDRASKIGPDTQAIHLRRARYLYLAGDKPAADKERQVANEHKAVTALDHFLVGEEYYLRDQPTQAVGELEKALQIRPDLFWAQYYVAISELRLHRISQAKTALAACLGRRPDFLWIYLVRGFANAEQDDFHAAETDFRRVANSLASSPDELLQYGLYVYRSVLRVRQGDKDPARLDDAVADLKKAIELRPQQYQAYVNLALTYEKQHHLAEAVAQMNQAIQLEPERGFLYRRRARLQIERHDDTAGLQDLDRAIGLEPAGSLSLALAEDLMERGRLLCRQDKYKEGIEAYDRALAIRPEMAVAYRWRAEAMLKLGQSENAIGAFNQYLRQGGTPDASLYRGRAQAKVALNRWSEAIEDYSKAITSSPDDTASYIGRGWAYVQASDLTGARSDFDKAVSLEPKNSYALLGRAYVSVQSSALQKGLADVEAVIRDGKPTPTLLVNAACVYALAMNKLDISAAGDRSLRTSCERSATSLLNQALDLVPASERAAFWARYVRANPDLRAVRQSPTMMELDRKFSSASR